MRKPVECTLFDLIKSVNQYTDDDQEATAVVAEMINSGTVCLSGKFAGATIDLSPAHSDCLDISLSPFRPERSTGEVPAG